MDDTIYVPVLHHFENGNVFTGSKGMLRFIIKPHDGLLTVSIWRGIFCLEKSEIEATEEFPLSADGHAQMCAWLESCRQDGPDGKEGT